MADKYARAGGGNWTTNGTWSTTSGGSADTVAPTAADNAILDANSGAVTVTSGSVCRSVNCTGYTNTLTHNAAATLTIGDATAGASNIALKFVSGMTYTINDPITSRFSFISTSATQQSVDFAGKTTGDVTFTASSNGSWQFIGAHVQGATATFTLTRGTLDINDQTCSWGLFVGSGAVARTLTLGSAAITILGASSTAWDFSSVTNLTFDAETSSITFSGASSGLSGGGQTFSTVAFTGSGTALVAGTNTFSVLTRTGTAVKTDKIDFSNDQTITTTLNLNGNSNINRILVESDTLGTTRTLTIGAATVAATNVDFKDITLGTATNLSGATGGSGDCGGNSGITFTTAAPKYWVGGTGSWGDPDNHWALSSGGSPGSGNLPLPQDDVFFDSNSFSAGGQTATNNMPRMGKTLDFSAVTNTPTIALSSTSETLYGGITLSSGMTLSMTAGGPLTFEGRGAFNVTCAGLTFSTTNQCNLTVQMVGGSLTCLDAFKMGTSRVFTLNNGTFDANDFDLQMGNFFCTGTAPRGVMMGNGNWNLTASGNTMWKCSITTNLTFDAEKSQINLTNSSNSKDFEGGGLTFNVLSVASGGLNNGATFSGSPTFRKFIVVAPRILRFAENSTTTFMPGGFIVSGFGVSTAQTTAGQRIFITSTPTAGTHNLQMSGSIVKCDYLSLSRSSAGGGAAWYAGAHSINSVGAVGWIFTDPPDGAGFSGGGVYGTKRFGRDQFGRGKFKQ